MNNCKNDLKTLLVTIEELREELHHFVGQGRSTLDPFVIKLSQDLDEELNKYYRLTNKQKNAVKLLKSNIEFKY